MNDWRVAMSPDGTWWIVDGEGAVRGGPFDTDAAATAELARLQSGAKSPFEDDDEEERERPITVSPGSYLVDPETGEVLFTAPKAPAAGGAAPGLELEEVYNPETGRTEYATEAAAVGMPTEAPAGPAFPGQPLFETIFQVQRVL